MLYPIDYLENYDPNVNSYNFNRENALKLLNQDKFRYLEFKYLCLFEHKLSDFYISSHNYNPKIKSKYILSNPYEIIASEYIIKVHIKSADKNYVIVNRKDSTHTLIQKFDSQMKLISQEIKSILTD